MSVAYFEEQRREMIAAIKVIAEHLVAEIGETALNDRVLKAMAKVPRHGFVPIEVQPYAYLNRPLPIGFDKTISQPLMVAVMTDLLDVKPDDVALEIGTGLGYQSAVLAELAGKVYTVEVIDELAQQAVQRLKREGYTNVEVRVGNGYFGWPEHAPFDKMTTQRVARPQNQNAAIRALIISSEYQNCRTAPLRLMPHTGQVSVKPSVLSTSARVRQTDQYGPGRL